MALQCNVGGTERTARLAAGVALLPVALFSRLSRPLRLLALVGGTIGLATGLSHYCPVNQLLGRNSCPEG